MKITKNEILLKGPDLGEKIDLKKKKKIKTYRNLLHFFTVTMQYQKGKVEKKKDPFKNCIKKNKTLRNKPDQGVKRLKC